MNQLATDVVVYPLVVQSIPQSVDRSSISHLLNPIQDCRSSIGHILNPGPADNVLDLTKTQCNASTERDQQNTSPGVGVDMPRHPSPIRDSSPFIDAKQPKPERSCEETGIKEVKEKGKKRPAAAPSGDRAGACKVGKSEKETAGSSLRKLGKIKEIQARSSIHARLQNLKYESGELQAKTASNNAFKAKVSKIDPAGRVIDPKTVRHSKCGKDLKMQTPFNIANFRLHVENCKGPPKSSKTPGGGMMTIDMIFKKQLDTQPLASAGHTKKITLPCPGLRKGDNTNIESYLERTGAGGGGGPSITSIANDLYGKAYWKLSSSRKRQVLVAQTHEWKWRNDHKTEAIFSTSCTKDALIYQPKPNLPQPCGSCQSLLQLKNFRNALKVPQPSDENYKYVNVQYRNDKIATIYGRCKGLREIFEASDMKLEVQPGQRAECRVLGYQRCATTCGLYERSIIWKVQG